MNPTRRTVLLAATGAFGAALLPAPSAQAAATPLQPCATYWYPDSLPSGTPGTGTPAAPTGLRVTAASGGDLRLAWSPAPGDVRHYTLHRVLADGTRRFLGGTCQQAYFVGGLQPEQGERAARLELRAVGELYTTSAPVTVTHPW